MPTILFFYYAPLLYGIGSITSRCSGKEPALKRRKSGLYMAEKSAISEGSRTRRRNQILRAIRFSENQTDEV